MLPVAGRTFAILLVLTLALVVVPPLRHVLLTLVVGSWGLAALAGLALLPWRRTRAVGTGVLLGALAGLVPVLVWVYGYVAPSFA